MSLRVLAILSAIGAAFAIAVVSVIFQDNITQFRLNPRTPYQTYTPPPPPAYGARGAWALWPSKPGEGDADIFYVHSTTYASNRHWNAPLTDKVADETLRRIAAPNEAGPFVRVGAVYGPRYRQATLFASFTHKFDGLAARQLAYGDIEHAFQRFLKEREPDRPIILAGYGQGGLYVLGLLQHYFTQNEDLLAHLAAAYVIGEAAPMALFDESLKIIPPCKNSADIRCLIAYTELEPGFEDDKRRHRQRSLVWTDERELESRSLIPHLCVNPLTWTPTEDAAEADKHLGAASATGLRLSATPPAIRSALGAQCDNGILAIDQPRQNFLRRRHWFGAHWRPQHFNLFYYDLMEDAARRTQNLTAELQKPAPTPSPVDLEPGPVNNVPN